MKEKKPALVVAAVILGLLFVAILVTGIVLGSMNNTAKLKAQQIKGNIKYSTSDDTQTAEVVIDGQRAEISKGKQAADKAEDEQDAETADSEAFICPFITERKITDADMEEIMSKDWGDLPSPSIPRMIINELYARYGYAFEKEEYKNYFESKKWYQDIGTYTSDMESISNQMSQLEKDNIDYLKSLEEKEEE